MVRRRYHPFGQFQLSTVSKAEKFIIDPFLPELGRVEGAAFWEPLKFLGNNL